MTKTMVILIMQELVAITIVRVIMLFYRQNSMKSKKQNRKIRFELLNNWSG